MRDIASFRRKNRNKKKKRIRKKISGTAERPRLVIFRSIIHIYAQLVDDVQHKTITGISSLSKLVKEQIGEKKTKKEIAAIVGQELSKKAEGLNISTVVFDRSGYLYHGRVKALAEGARKGGLKF